MMTLRRLMTTLQRLITWWFEQTKRVKGRGWRLLVFVSPVLFPCMMVWYVATSVSPEPATTPTPAVVAARATQETAPAGPTLTPQPTNMPVVTQITEVTRLVEAIVTPPISPPSNLIPPGAVEANLVRVIDGDTIEVTVNEQLETVRFIGIDTPERGQPGYKAATAANQALLSTELFLVLDQTDRDRDSRLLRYIYTRDGIFVNAEMISQGWAQPVEYSPDTQYAEEFSGLAVQAAQEKRGFWSGNSGADGAMSYAITNSRANVRKGPGTEFEISGQTAENLPLTVFGRNEAGDWLQVRTPDRTGGWISAGLVALNVAVAQITVPDNVPAPAAVRLAPTVPVAVGPAPTALVASAPSGSEVQITDIKEESDDEMITVANSGDAPVDLSGWRIQSYGAASCKPQDDQIFVFPGRSVLQPGASVRVHSGPSAQQSPPTDLLWTIKPIWSNERDRADLLDADGNKVSTYAYDGC